MKLGLSPAIGKNALAFAIMLGLATAMTLTAQAQTFNVIHNFGGSDGANPLTGFTVDAARNMYGTTENGGASDAGAVFKLTASGNETVLYSFTGGPTDGCNPVGGLLLDKLGNLYGTTGWCGSSGTGTIFKVSRDGTEKVLYNFGKQEGATPQSSLVMDAAGNLYGTTTAGGSAGNGTVFELARPKKQGGSWIEKVLYSFGSGTDGAVPLAGVTFDAAGNLYGTTSVGGANSFGTIFQLVRSKSTWIENILYNFQDADDGGTPYAGLIIDHAGNLFGGATSGGTGAGGTIFELAPSKKGWKYTVLYSISGWSVSGPFRDLMLDASGNLYGTTHCDGADSSGTVYKLTHSKGTWTYTLLYSFTGGTDGLYVFSNLVLDKQGNLYGTTNQGGANSLGVIFKVTP
jgi:uncharacterized repeat protein (TIGR03803 family)